MELLFHVQCMVKANCFKSKLLRSKLLQKQIALKQIAEKQIAEKQIAFFGWRKAVWKKISINLCIFKLDVKSSQTAFKQ